MTNKVTSNDKVYITDPIKHTITEVNEPLNRKKLLLIIFAIVLSIVLLGWISVVTMLGIWATYKIYTKMEENGIVTVMAFTCSLVTGFVVWTTCNSVTLPYHTEFNDMTNRISTSDVITRISCDSISISTRVDTIKSNVTLTKNITIIGIVFNDILTTTKVINVTPNRFTVLVNKGTSYNQLANCDDTTKKVESVPYTDKNFNFQIITKTFINHTSWKSDTKVEYKNQSPKLDISDVNKMLQHYRAIYTHSKQTIKYMVKFIDNDDSTLVETESKATELIKSRCKEKATTLSKFVYTEYDACIKNTSTKEIYSYSSVHCGTSTPVLTYSQGVIAFKPSTCDWGANWTWSTWHIGTRLN